MHLFFFFLNFHSNRLPKYLTAKLPDIADNQQLQLLPTDVLVKFADEAWFLKNGMLL